VTFIARFGYRYKDLRAANCTVDEQVGMWVCIVGNKVAGKDQVRKADPMDYTKWPSVGVIVNKSTVTNCIVQWFGETEGIFSGLSAGEPYFVGLDSYISDNSPTPLVGLEARAQKIGVATSETQLYVMPSSRWHLRRG
jgi:hypothetical protein